MDPLNNIREKLKVRSRGRQGRGSKDEGGTSLIYFVCLNNFTSGDLGQVKI